MSQYLPRNLEKQLQELFKSFPVVVLSGARQVGKSTLLTHAFPQLPRVVFDPVIDVEGARADPDRFLNNRPAPLILDEIQYSPQLVSAIKRRLDQNRQPGQYLLTGSQQWGVMKLLAESLAGRAVFLDLWGFNLLELVQTHRTCLELWLSKAGEVAAKDFSRLPLKKNLYEQIWRGFLPEAQFLPLDQVPIFHSAYQRTYIERDLRDLADISDLESFGRFFRLCAALSAQEINFSQLGRELGLSPQTAQRWLALLKAGFQWFEIPAFSNNTIKRISSKPKGYFGDTGLACTAQAISTPEALGAHPQWGALFETLVVGEIKKQAELLATPPRFYHWRSHGGAEVDLILERDGHYFPMEIKAHSHPSAKDARGIKAFRETYPHLSIKPGLVVAPCESFYPVSENNFAMPWDVGVRWSGL